jgi:hypothetical protein
MATLGTTHPTLVDISRRTGADGKINLITEMLSTTNEILTDMSFQEGNLPTGHRTTIRSGLPTATWRLLNYGVQPSKSSTVQITDGCGMLEAYAEVDKALADLNGNSNAYRQTEDEAFLEGMNQEMASTLFYGDSGVDPEKFTGLSARFNDLSAENGGNIVDAGGTGSDNTSVWMVCWGPQTCHGIFPKGSQAGFSHDDKGQVTLEDDAGGKYEGYRTHYKWDVGLTVRDWRYVVRVANIDVSDLTKDAASGADLVDLMVQALELVPNLNTGRAAFYANRTVFSFLRRQIANKDNVNLSLDDVGGKKVVAFDGVPVRRTDAILSTEAQIS